MYIFAIILLVIVNICTIAFLSKYIFSDLKRQSRDFGEKAAELLKMYEGVEDFMETFYTESGALKSELEALTAEVEAMKAGAPAKSARAVSAPAAEREETETMPVPETTPVPVQEEAAAKRPRPSEPRKWDLFEAISREASAGLETATAADSDSAADPAPGENAAGEVQDDAGAPMRESKLEGVIRLYREGKTHSQIAKKLGVTKNEVDLIIKMHEDVLTPQKTQKDE
jgi:hypothetical protein